MDHRHDYYHAASHNVTCMPYPFQRSHAREYRQSMPLLPTITRVPLLSATTRVSLLLKAVCPFGPARPVRAGVVCGAAASSHSQFLENDFQPRSNCFGG